MYEIGTKVRHIRFPGRSFQVTGVSVSDAGLLYRIQDLITGDPLVTEGCFIEEYDFMTRGLSFCVHTKSKDPMRLPEKHFEPWYICTKCGEAVERFSPNKADAFDLDEDTVF